MTVKVVIEAGTKKTFARAIDWPGWWRAGKTEELALEALADAAARYAVATEIAGESFAPSTYDVVDHVAGGAGTDFGVPSVITDADRRPVSAAGRGRRAVGAARKPADQLGQPAHIDGDARVLHPLEQANDEIAKPMTREPGGDDRVVVRPDRPVVVRHRVVAHLR